MKISEVTIADFRDFARIPEDEKESSLAAIMAAGRAYVRSNTGLDDAQIDMYEDITLAYLVLCAEMYDNRALTVQTEKINPLVQSVLALHATNYL